MSHELTCFWFYLSF